MEVREASESIEYLGSGTSDGAREELERREGLYLDVLELVGGRVGLRDDDVVAAGERCAELLPDGRELLAVTAPRSVCRHSHGSLTLSCVKLHAYFKDPLNLRI